MLINSNSNTKRHTKSNSNAKKKTKAVIVTVRDTKF